MSLALAQMRIAAGDTTTPTTFRDSDNVDHDLTPAQILTMWQESAAYVSAIYQASCDIKAMNPIPAEWPITSGRSRHQPKTRNGRPRITSVRAAPVVMRAALTSRFRFLSQS